MENITNTEVLEAVETTIETEETEVTVETQYTNKEKAVAAGALAGAAAVGALVGALAQKQVNKKELKEINEILNEISNAVAYSVVEKESVGVLLEGIANNTNKEVKGKKNKKLVQAITEIKDMEMTLNNIGDKVLEKANAESKKLFGSKVYMETFKTLSATITMVSSLSKQYEALLEATMNQQ